MTRRRHIILFLAAIVLGIVAVAGYVTLGSQTNPEKRVVSAPQRTFKLTKKLVAECTAGDIKCHGEALANVAYLKGPEAALERMNESIRAGQLQEGNCHGISHEIGLGGSAHYKGDVDQALAIRTLDCTGGYYHGVLIEAFATTTPAGLNARVAKFCTGESEQAPSAYREACAHGVGHGAMVYLSYDLERALPLCDKMAREDHNQCWSGVFMEAFQAGEGRDPSRWTREGETFHPCPSMTPKHKDQCYLEYIAKLRADHSDNWSTLVKLCGTAERGYVYICYQGLSRHIGSAMVQSKQASRVPNLCSRAGAYAGVCLAEASAQFAGTLRSVTIASTICAAASRQFQGDCYGGLAGQLHTMLPPAQLARECSTLPQKWQQACQHPQRAPEPATSTSL